MAKMGRPPAEKPKSAGLFIRLEPETKARLEEYSKANGIRVSEVVRSAIEKFLNDSNAR